MMHFGGQVSLVVIFFFFFLRFYVEASELFHVCSYFISSSAWVFMKISAAPAKHTKLRDTAEDIKLV